MAEQGVGLGLGAPSAALVEYQFDLWAENCVFAVAQGHTAQPRGCVALRKETPHFFWTEKILANLGNVRLALESMANWQCWDVESADGFLSFCLFCM